MTEPTLLLMHGLGATSGVWAELLAELQWPGKVLNVDLPGHGAAPTSADYTLGALASAVGDSCENGEEVIAVGHSLGGCVGLCLASGFFRPVVRAVVSVGIKVRWTDDDVAGMARVAAKGIRWFDTREQAVDRFLLQAGLSGLVESDHPAVSSGVVEEGGQWRVSQDPATFAQQPVDGPGLVSAVQCPVILGAGAADSMVTREDLAQLAALSDWVAEPHIAVGSGHNVQIEDPSWFAALVREAASRVE